MQRTSVELSREGKRVEIKAFVCIYVDEAGQIDNKPIYTSGSGWMQLITGKEGKENQKYASTSRICAFM